MNQVDPIWIRFSLSESDLAKLPDRSSIASSPRRCASPSRWLAYPLPAAQFCPTQIDPGSPRRNCARRSRNRACGCFPAVRAGPIGGGASATTCSSFPDRGHPTEKTFLVFTLDKENKARPARFRWATGSAHWMILGASTPATGDFSTTCSSCGRCRVSPQPPAERRPRGSGRK